jgi:hypothetical protein
MKKLLAALVLVSSMAQAQEVFRIEAGGTEGMCLKGFTQNEKERFCIKPPRPDGLKIISKPEPVTGCVSPWVSNGTQCIAILRVAKVPTQ